MLARWMYGLVRFVWTVVGLPLRLLRWSLSRKEETYSALDHLALNVVSPQTEWLNMGNWQDTKEFPLACHNLAKLLYKEAGLYPKASVLDVGHASGDSLLLLAREHNPTLLHGVTSIPAHALRAKRRIGEQIKAQEKAPALSWQVFCNDAVAFLHQEKEQRYDFILALDCAYHFQTRKDFLQACAHRLNPGGKVALVDLIASHPYPDQSPSSFAFTPSPTLPPPPKSRAQTLSLLKHYLVTLVSGVPLGNLVCADQYHADLQDAGFENIAIKDVSHLVFPGFANFLKHLGKGGEAAWRGGGTLQTHALNSFGSVVEGWSRGGQEGMIRCVTVVAQTDRVRS